MEKNSRFCKYKRCCGIVSLLFFIAAPSAGAQAASPLNVGYIFRADRMLADDNVLGVSDQLNLAEQSAFTSAERQEAEWLKCLAEIRLNSGYAEMLLREFIAGYPASRHIDEARMNLGDCILLKNPSEAYEIYCNVNENALTEEREAALCYQKGYALLSMYETSRHESELLPDASRMFARAASDPRLRSGAEFYQGYIAYLQNDYPSAINFFTRVERSGSPAAMADYYLAQIYYKQADYARASSVAQGLLNRKNVAPEYYAEALRIAGESYYRLGKVSAALPLLEEYVELEEAPLSSALYILGVQYFNEGKTDRALTMLNPVAARGADDAMTQSANLFIGQSLMVQGDRDAAILAFDKALRSDADIDVQEAAYYNYCVAKFGGARIPFANSADVFEEFITRFPNGKYSKTVVDYLADGYISNGNYEAAVKVIDKQPNPSSKALRAKQQALYALGTKALAANDAPKAETYLMKAKALASQDKATAARVSLSLGEAMARQKNHSGAIPEFKQYLSSAPSDDINRPLAYYDLAYSYFALKKYSDAAENFELMLKKPGNLPNAVVVDALNRLGDIKLYAGKYGDALGYYTSSISKNPSSGDYPLFQSALIYGYQRNYKDKINALENLMARYPDSSLVPDAMLEMTEGYIRLGDSESAIKVYRQLMADYPSTEQARRGALQLALTLANNGKAKEADEAYRRVVTLYPTSEEASMAVDELKRKAADAGTLAELNRWLSEIDGAPRLDVSETDRLTFEAAEKDWITKSNSSRMKAYLADYPAGAYRLQALGYLAEAAAKAGNHPEVIAYTSELIEKFPHSARAESALYQKASAEYALGQYEEALATWRELSTRASSAEMRSAAWMGILRAARDVNRHADVIEAADRLLAMSSLKADMRSEAIFARAFALAGQGRTDMAIDEWRKLSPAKDDVFGAKSSYYLAETLFESGDIDGSRSEVESLIDSGTPHSYWLARGFILLSDIYKKEGKVYEAREYLISLRDNYPGTEPDIFIMIDERLK